MKKKLTESELLKKSINKRWSSLEKKMSESLKKIQLDIKFVLMNFKNEIMTHSKYTAKKECDIILPEVRILFKDIFIRHELLLHEQHIMKNNMEKITLENEILKEKILNFIKINSIENKEPKK